jgi:tetratricopeptide (TPR) repeat protein
MRQGNVDSLEAVLARIPADWDDGGMATFSRFVVLRLQRRPDDALALLDGARHAISRDGLVYRPVTLMRAHLLEDLHDGAGARSNFERARQTLENSVAAHPRDGPIRVALGLAYAGLGRRVEAVREARTAMELAPLSADNPTATAVMGVAAEVFARAGEMDAALELLELLLAIPAGREISVPLLRIDPAFDPLRTDPRFDRLMERFSKS